MAWSLADAAAQAGLGITLLPVLYERAGFTQPGLRPDQRRFASSPDFIAHLQHRAAESGRPLLNAGVAVHSLRAASLQSIASLMKRVGQTDMPVHIHVAEQMQEVHDCLAATRQRPVQWLLEQGLLDTRWQLVHATHVTAQEVEGVANSNAGIVICPSTEGNLGDGFTDVPAWLNQRVPMAIGSDSHVCRQWPEELRWLEYGQRLQLQKRNVAAAPSVGMSSTAMHLFQSAQTGGGQAAGQALWGLTPGARADLLVLNPQAPGLLGIPMPYLLDAVLFACDSPPFSEVYVAGRQVIANGHHAAQAQIATRFADAMQSLWG
jgi:formimidoylglutamate deiminase